MRVVLLIGIICYIATAVAFAVYLLFRAYSEGVGEFEKVAIGALIAVIGTGLTALAAIYTAVRQAAAAREVELLRLETGKVLAQLTSDLNRDLQSLQAQSAQSLERLKAALDAGKIAYRELGGSAAVYFYALRSVALGTWDEQLLKTAEAAMVGTSQHLMFVSDVIRADWLNFWQEAQHIYRATLEEPDEGKRPQFLGNAIKEQVRDGRSRLNLRDRYSRLEMTIRQAIEDRIG